MKDLNKKRFLSTVLAGAMALSLAVPAFAAEGDEGGNTPDPNTTVITATYEDIEMNVIVPQTGTASINPYGLPVDVEKSDNSKATLAAGQQILSQPLYIKNQMGMGLKVGATVTAAVTGGFKFAATEAAITGQAADAENGVAAIAPATTNSGFVFLQSKASAVTGADNAVADDLIDEYAAWTAQAYNSATDVILGTKAVEQPDFATLVAAKMDDTTGAFDEYDAGSILLLRLAGKVVEAPKTPWKAADGFSTTVVFTFKPATN